MGLFKSLKGDQPEDVGGTTPSNSHHNNPFRRHHESPQAPQEEEYQAPPGPPPSQKPSDNEYQPPPGPPPSHKGKDNDYQPPPGPPPSYEPPEAYHDWTAIPDTALLPPPPALNNKYSPTSNAEEAEAIRAHQWCERYSLMRPKQPTDTQLAVSQSGMLALHVPFEFKGNISNIGPGRWRGSTRAGSKDCCLLTSLPLYFAVAHSPFRTQTSKTIYFEIKCISLGSRRAGNENSLAIGYCAVPYPTWRLPGWERGSLGVHSDDGRRYVNDTDGGVDFTAPFKAGETIGLGMTFSAPNASSALGSSLSQDQLIKAETFLTRDGKWERAWNIHEELDSESEFGVLGVDGLYDLFGAIGVFGEITVEVSFNSSSWLWQPR